ncbi:MAG: Ldh family oxidoreductase [Anaerolineae bacterium]|nr:Ldh family oxidoreductase [Anaerolineae bacterium]
MLVIPSEQLQPFVCDIFVAADTPRANAERVAAALVGSNLVGHDSHGVIRVPQYISAIRQGRIDPAARPEVESETACTARITGHWGWGQVAAWEATAVAIAKARQSGLAAVVLHSSNHVGRVGEYVEEIARHDMVGLATLNNHGAAMQVAPFGGRERRLSSNPIAFAAPTSGDPILVDMTSSVVAEGKVRVLRNQGKLAPDGWLIDAEGRPTNDPRVLYADPPGALLPLGGPLGHKGYGLSVMIEVLSGALSGAGCSSPRHERIGNAMFIEAVRVDAYVPREEYLGEVDELVASLRSCAPAAGFSEVLIPGEPERRTEVLRRKQGIPIDEETWHQLTEVAGELHVPVPPVRQS